MNDLAAAVEQAKDFGFQVWWEPPATDDAGNRVRCEVGRYLDDGVFYVALHSGQSEDEALTALHVAQRRLMNFDHEQWQVKLTEPPVAVVVLCDSPGLPMELHRDVVRLLGR